MNVSFDDLISTYLELLTHKNNSNACFKWLGKMEMYQELFPTEEQAYRLKHLPAIANILSVRSPYFQNEMIKMVVKIAQPNLSGSGNIYSIVYVFDSKIRKWLQDEQEPILKNDFPLTEAEEKEFYSLFPPMRHPTLLAEVAHLQKQFDLIFQLEHCPFDQVSMKNNKIFFTFKDNNDTFYYDLYYKVILRNGASAHDYDKYFSMLFHETNFLERLQNHPNLRLKELFQ